MMASAAGASPQATFAADAWTQWGGPNRDFMLTASSPLSWPDGGFKEVWRRPLGEGYSGIVGDSTRLYTMLRRDNQEVVVAIDAANGNALWLHAYDATLFEGADTSFGRGPNATPLLAGNKLITVGFNGLAKCFDTQSGKVLWSVDLFKDLNGSKVVFGYSACPFLFKDTLIFPVGGPNSGVVALRLADGTKAWSAHDFTNTYSTPKLINVDGQDQLVLVMSEQVAGLDPANGKLLWQFPFKNQWNTHVVVPVWGPDNILFVASFEQANGLRLKRSGDTTHVEELWSNNKAGISHTNAVRIGDTVYATIGDSRAAFAAAIDVKTGEVLWKERGLGLANCVAFGDRVLFLDENGQLALAKPDRKALNILGKNKPLQENRMWTPPTFVGDMLFARDQKDIVALKLR